MRGVGAYSKENSEGGKNPFHNNQFGGSLGGPIIKDRTFFYADYEGQRETGAQAGTSCVPFPRQIAHDTAANGPENSVIASLLALNPYPAPNIPSAAYNPVTPDDFAAFDTGCPTGNNLSTSTRFRNRVDSLIAKIDHNFNTSNMLTVEDFLPNQAQPQDSTNPAGDRADSSFDIRRRFTWNFTYSFPKWSGSMAKLRNGWGLDGTLNLQDGQPWQLNYEFEGDYSGAAEGFDRPDVIGPLHYSPGNPAEYLDLTSFAAPCTWGNSFNDGDADESSCIPGTRHFGTEGRNSLMGPSFKEFNFSVFKNTALSERVTLNLRAEFFNLFNHPNFSNPSMPNYIADIGTPDLATGRHSGFYAITA
ncbi:MAG TPA: hypothetical protein VLV49_17135, partial [Terriglobales bacterium]|nr:hypothetical protein [Terriglobales bacterium]